MNSKVTIPKNITREQRSALVEEYLKQINATLIYAKCPSNFSIHEVELQGNLCIIKGQQTAFGKIRDTTRVFKRVQ